MRCSTVLLAILLAGLLPVYATGQTLPRGYHVVQATQSPAWDKVGQVNRHGQVIFLRWPDVPNRASEEIFLYDARTGELTQTTDDDVQDVLPDINDAGLICWSRRIGPIDPVARFHLRNGAGIERINWLADTSRRGLDESAGMMVNYLYKPDMMESNHEAFTGEGRIMASKAVRAMEQAK